MSQDFAGLGGSDGGKWDLAVLGPYVQAALTELAVAVLTAG